MLRTLFTLLPLMGTALAHLQMKDPLPIDSPLGAGQPKNVDSYSYTAPLKLDGSQWPCHGQAYLSDPSLLTTRATWSAGSTQSFTVAPPGAEHGGGSCQLSLSYDNGQTWNVIWSWIGGCMADTSQFTQQFELPQEAPNGKALFAWGWFNQLGNREMYHNCAVVEITNGGSGLNPTDYPAPFVANAGVNQCSTIENVDPVFPNPGKNVKYGGAYAGSKPEAGKGITGSGCDAPGGANGPGSSGGNGNGNGNGGSNPATSSSSAAPPAGSGSYSQGEGGSSGSGSGIAISVSLGAHVLAPVGSSTDAASAASASAPAATSTASTATASSSPSGSGSGQRTCRRRRRRSNRTKRAAAPAAPQPNETEHVEARVMRSRLFAQAAGHAARLYNPHTRLTERF